MQVRLPMSQCELIAALAEPGLEDEQATVHARDRHPALLAEVRIVAPRAAFEGGIVVLGVEVEVGNFGQLSVGDIGRAEH